MRVVLCGYEARLGGWCCAGTRLDWEGGVVCQRNTGMQTRQSDVMITFKTYMFTIT